MSSLRTWLFALVVLAISTTSFAQVRISVALGPPPIPVYVQPICPGDGYIWIPGYWAWDSDGDDYFWVPGTWVLAPEVGFFWTPPYWAWDDGAFLFYEGYWGPRVGFYGGINYGFGYFGSGFVGGRWDGDRFFYNRSVTNINVVNVHNVYNQTVINNNVTVNRVSYNGGPGGINARPRPEDEIAARERHLPPVSVQAQQVQAARSDRGLRASANQGKPPIAATPRPTEFHDRSVVHAKAAGGPYRPPANRGVPQPRSESGGPRIHPNDFPAVERAPRPNTGDANRDRKYQQQQDKLFTRQEQERQKLQQKQEQEHQRTVQRNAGEAQRQQMEQRHQQQTEQMRQRHDQQRQQLQDRQQEPKRK